MSLNNRLKAVTLKIFNRANQVQETEVLGRLHTTDEPPYFERLDASSLDAVNSQFIDQHKRKTKHIPLYSVLASAVILVILLYSNLIPKNLITNSITPTATDAYTEKELEIEKVANEIITIRIWSKEDTNKFIEKWRKLDYASRVKLRDNAWFQHLAALTETRLKKYQRLNESSEGKHKLSLAAVTQLAANIGTSETESNKFRRALDDVSTELANVEANKIYGSLSSAEPAEAEPEKVAKLGKLNQINIEATPRLRTLDLDSFSRSKKSRFIQRPIEQAVRLTGDNISNLLEQYSYAYKRGNTDLMLTLFGGGASPQNSLQGSPRLRAKFNTVFKISKQREIKLDNLHWQYQNNTAVGTGQISAQLIHSNDLTERIIVADANITIGIKNNRLYFDNFQIENANIILPDSFLVTTSRKKHLIPDAPTAGELQDIITRLIGSYESGDIEAFQSLFVKNAKTNGLNDLTQITREYMELFNNTAERQMFIQDLHWSFGEKHAKGIGKLDVLVTSEKGEQLHSVTGSIEIVARRVKQKVYISHLYNVTNEN